MWNERFQCVEMCQNERFQPVEISQNERFQRVEIYQTADISTNTEMSIDCLNKATSTCLTATTAVMGCEQKF